jgi:hypothetical protein
VDIINPSCAAASSYTPSITLHPNLLNVIIVRRITFDSIEATGAQHLWPFTIDSERDQRILLRCHKFIQTQFKLKQLTSKESRSELATVLERFLVGDCIIELCQLLHIAQGTPYPTGEDFSTVIWKTLVCDRAQGSMVKATPAYRDIFDYFLTSMAIIDQTWNPPRVSQDVACDMQKLSMSSDWTSIVERRSNIFRSGASSFSFTRKRARTARGYVGQFPMDARVGDLAIGLCGSFLGSS